MGCSSTLGRLSTNYPAKVFFSLTPSGFHLNYLSVFSSVFLK